MKKIKPFHFLLPFLLTIIIVWVIISINQPPNWKGQTADGQIVTDFKSNKSAPTNWWEGTIYTEHKEVVIEEIIIEQNGKFYFRNDHLGAVSRKQPMQYMDHAGAWENKEDEYVMLLRWRNGEGVHEEVIKLIPKTRFFVLPRPGFREWGWNKGELFI